MDERTDRSHDTREDFVREDDSWIPSSVLPTPDPQNGWRFRWIRTSTLGQTDDTNVSRKFREGWTPVRREDHPELKITSDINSQFKGNIEQGGLLLCKAPEEKMTVAIRRNQNGYKCDSKWCGTCWYLFKQRLFFRKSCSYQDCQCVRHRYFLWRFCEVGYSRYD